MIPYKVLIIEDERFLARMLSTYLTNKGHKVVGMVSSAEEAIELAREKEPDLLLVDIELDGKMNGIEACEKINEFSDAAIIYLSQFESKEWTSRIQSTRPAFFLSKPFQEHELDMNLGLLAESHKQAELAPMRNYVFLKDKDINVKVSINDVLFLEAARSSCSLMFSDNRKVTVSMSLKSLITKLNHPKILRISRSYAVNIEQVSGFAGNKLFIQHHELTLSNDYKNYVMRKINEI